MRHMNDAAPEGYNTLNPYVTVRDVPRFLDFLKDAFGGVVKEQIKQPDGRIEHAEVSIGDSIFMVGPPSVDALSKSHDRVQSGAFYLLVADVEATYTQAMTAGAYCWAVPDTGSSGSLIAAVTDRYGNAWWIADRKRRSGNPSPSLGYRMINPYISIADPAGLISFVKNTFDGELMTETLQTDRQVQSAEIRIGNSILMLGPPQLNAPAQADYRPRPGTFYLFVSDVDAVCERAVAQGAKLVEAPADRFYGDRVAEIEDAYGNHWWLATRAARLGEEQVQEKADEHWASRSRATGRTVGMDEVLAYMQAQRYAVQASTTASGLPQAALISIAVNSDFEVFFDTFSSTRKAANLSQQPNVAFVIGGGAEGDQRTVQYEGTVDSPTGPELEALKNEYFSRHPDGLRRSGLPGIRYFRARPRWIRYTNFNAAPAQIAEFEGQVLEVNPKIPLSASTPANLQVSAPWRPAMHMEPDFNAFAAHTHVPEP